MVEYCISPWQSVTFKRETAVFFQMKRLLLATMAADVMKKRVWVIVLAVAWPVAAVRNP